MSDPEPTKPIEMIPTDELIAELKRRCLVHVLALVLPVERQPGVVVPVPTITWGARSTLAHEALGLAHQAADAIMIEARSQLDIGKQGVEEYFNSRAHARRNTIAPLTYTYIPPGTPPGTNP